MMTIRNPPPPGIDRPFQACHWAELAAAASDGASAANFGGGISHQVRTRAPRGSRFYCHVLSRLTAFASSTLHQSNYNLGKYHHGTVAADQFSVRVKRAGKVFTQVLSVDDGRDSEALRGWVWGMRLGPATYHALFPRAWTVYEVRANWLVLWMWDEGRGGWRSYFCLSKRPKGSSVNPSDHIQTNTQEAAPLIKLTCRQVSPVMPHDYIDSSLPVSGRASKP